MAGEAATGTATPLQVPPKTDETVKTPVTTGAAGASSTPPKQEGSATPPAAKAEEQKPAGTLLGEATPKEGEPKKDSATPPVKADYSKLKIPDGSMLPATSVDAVKAFAEKHNLSAEAAQAELEERHGAVKSHFDSLVQQHKAQVEQWKSTVKAHPKFGGANLKATDEAVTQVFTRFAPKGLLEKVQADGYNWHPEFLEFLHNIHESTKSDTFVSGGKVATTKDFVPDLSSKYKDKK